VGEAVAVDPQPVRQRVDLRRPGVVAHEEPRLRRAVAVVLHRLPAGLGVGAVVDEPGRRQRLLDGRRAGRGPGRGPDEGAEGGAGPGDSESRNRETEDGATTQRGVHHAQRLTLATYSS